jgi:hypothetical protein
LFHTSSIKYSMRSSLTGKFIDVDTRIVYIYFTLQLKGDLLAQALSLPYHVSFVNDEIYNVLL